MHQSNRQMVLEFTEKMDQPVGYVVEKTRPELYGFRLQLIEEEIKEMVQAMQGLWATVDKGNSISAYKAMKSHVLKEICDVMYVLEGFCVTYGMDSTEAFKRIHESNMSKLGDKDEDGKVQKGENYQPPNLQDLVNDESENYTHEGSGASRNEGTYEEGVEGAGINNAGEDDGVLDEKV